jgi:hypothetical protein
MKSESWLFPCVCGHDHTAHLGHVHPIGTPEPTHCSQGCGCKEFQPAVAAVSFDRVPVGIIQPQYQFLYDENCRLKQELFRLDAQLTEARRALSAQTERAESLLRQLRAEVIGHVCAGVE